MKKILYILFFLFCQNILGQSNIDEKIFYDIINHISYSEGKSEIGYFKTVPIGMLNYELENFKKHPSLTYKMYQRNTGFTDSIKLTRSEKKFIMKQLKASKDFEWNLVNKTNLIIVENDSPLAINTFLGKDRNRELKIVSKPIFLRNGLIACVYSAHLCCGQIYGHTSLSLYRLIDDKWTEWIALTQGDF